MKKLMLIMAALVIACGAYAAQGDRVVTKISIPTALDLTVTTNYIPINVGVAYRAIEKIIIKNNSTSSAITVLSIADGGVFTTIGTYTNATTVSAASFPLRAGSYGTTTNPVPFLAQNLRAITTLSATNILSADIDFRIYGRE